MDDELKEYRLMSMKGLNSALISACAAGNEKLVSALISSPFLRKKANPLTCDAEPLMAAARNGRIKTIEILASIPEAQRAFHQNGMARAISIACSAGSFSTVQAIFSAGGSISPHPMSNWTKDQLNRKYDEWLHQACQVGSLQLVEFFVEKIEFDGQAFGNKDATLKLSKISSIVRGGNPQILSLMLSKADPNDVPSLRINSYLQACRLGQVEIAALAIAEFELSRSAVIDGFEKALRSQNPQSFFRFMLENVPSFESAIPNEMKNELSVANAILNYRLRENNLADKPYAEGGRLRKI